MSLKALLVALLMAAIVVTGWIVWSSNGDHTAIQPDEPVACTADALLCPDGSGVGRQGPDCSFNACPVMDSVIGTLEQTSEGFRLVLGATGTIGSEVSYTMPLELTVSNVVQEFLGQRVRVYGDFSTGNTYVVDHFEALEGAAADPTKATLGIGESTFIHGVRVTLHEVVQDSRCPSDVTCITAGFVRANVTLTSDTDELTTMLDSNEPLNFDSFVVTLTEVTPTPISTSEIEDDAYHLTFTVTPRSTSL